MSPREVSEPLIRDAPLLRSGDTVGEAVKPLLASDLPALPVVDERERLVGIFGEREFLGAVFPGYVKELKHAGFVRRSLDEALEKREECRLEPISRHMLAEIFLHHRVLIVPVTEDGRVVGVITRADFYRSVAQRFLEKADPG